MQSLNLGRPLPSLSALAVQIALWLPWALATPAIFACHRRLALTQQPKGRVALHLAGHVLLAALAGLLYTAGLAVVELLMAGRELPSFLDLLTLIWHAGRSSVLLGALIYGLVLAAATALEMQRVARDRDHELTRARLQVLRNQLRPHFLFNTLHAIGSLVDEDPRGAQKMITRLSDLLRASLDADELDLVPLSEELSLVGRYLEIEAVRFEDRLTVQWEVDETLHQELVPRFILQALAENAICHAIEPSRGGGRILVSATRETTNLVLRVLDDGPGPEAAGRHPSSRGLGVGLVNTRARLAAIFGDQGSLGISARDGGGTSASVVIPLSTNGTATELESNGARHPITTVAVGRTP